MEIDMVGDRLRILHLTDLHMRQALAGTANQTERLSRDIPKFLECLGDRLSEWTPDVIVMTGDLLDVPDEVVDESLSESAPGAYAEAVAEATLDYRWIHDWLEGTALEWVVIPGNHDHRAAFVNVFSTTSPDTVRGGWRFIGFDDALDERRTPVRLDGEQLRFNAALGGENDRTPQIHLQHYILRPRLFRRTAYSYQGDAELAARVDLNPRVRAVLSGHYHPGAYARSANGVTYSTGPAFCETPYPFRIMDLDAGRVKSVFDQSID
jgi:Icc protein